MKQKLVLLQYLLKLMNVQNKQLSSQVGINSHLSPGFYMHIIIYAHNYICTYLFTCIGICIYIRIYTCIYMHIKYIVDVAIAKHF